MTPYPVTTYYVDDQYNVQHSTSVYFNERRANAACVEEMKWKSTVRVVCIPLGVDVEGDYVGVLHTFGKA